MQFGSWIFSDPTTKVHINKISMVLPPDKVKKEGDAKSGNVIFVSERQYDEIWGPEAKLEVSWEYKDPTQYHHGLKVKETIRMFGSIEVVAVRKETRWHLSHEMTYWYGTRQQILRKRFYPTMIIHAVVFCEQSQRLYNAHASTIAGVFAKYESILLDTIFSLQCHE